MFNRLTPKLFDFIGECICIDLTICYPEIFHSFPFTCWHVYFWMGEKMMPSILFYFSVGHYTVLYLLANPFQHFISWLINVKKLFWQRIVRKILPAKPAAMRFYNKWESHWAQFWIQGKVGIYSQGESGSWWTENHYKEIPRLGKILVKLM